MDKGSTWRCCSESSHSSSLVILLVHSFYAWDQDPTSYQGWSKKGWRFGGMSLWWRWGSSLCPLWMRSRCACAVSSVTQSCLNLCSPMDCSMPGFPVHHQLPQLIQTHVHWVSDDIQPSYPLSSPSPPTFSLSQHQGPFHRVSSSHQVAKLLEFKLQHQSFSEYSGLFSFRIDWLDLLAVQRTLKSLLQHHSLKASILFCSAFFMVQLSHPYMTTEKNHSFDYMDLCWQNNLSAFLYAV